jgi:hypothetical protein
MKQGTVSTRFNSLDEPRICALVRETAQHRSHHREENMLYAGRQGRLQRKFFSWANDFDRANS